MVDSAANVLLETLRDVLVEEVKFLSGVRHEVDKVEADLQTIHGLLMDADQIRDRCNSKAFQDCINQLKELAFKAENVLETYAVEHHHLKKWLQRLMGIFCECYNLHKVGNEINDIRSSLTNVTAGLRNSISGGGEAGLSNSTYQEQMQLLRRTYAHEDVQHFVGMEKDIRSVVSMVKDDNSPFVISICGMGGLGKTTLAKKIYHHQDVIGEFDGFAWVCATQQFQAKTVLKEIFEKIRGQKGDMELSALVEGIYDVLKRRKCLIVIDDIWESGHWNILKPAFPRKNCKVVLTTRNENIAYEEGRVHNLDFLSEDEGWDLLKKITSPPNDAATCELEDIGRQMVRKCGCLPLAISVIGGILKHKQQILTEWENVNNNMDSYLRHGGEGIHNDERVKLVLDLSFNALPYYLKPCFLYLACFPEDAEIDIEKLYRLWLAEGLISSEEKGNNETLRDVAERYLIELSLRCMVQVKKGDFNHKKFESVRLHDLIRDLCSSKAEHEKFMKCVDISKHDEDIRSMGNSIHRLAFVGVENIGDAIQSMGQVKDLRSILFLDGLGISMRSMDFQSIVEHSKHLKVLLCEGLAFEGGNLPSTIGKQIYLKYLSLYESNVYELPEEVCNLRYLQTLDLRVQFELTLPNLICKLKRLRNLFLPFRMHVIGGGKLKLDGLNELETLGVVRSPCVCVGDIINLRSLRSVEVYIEYETDTLSKIVDYMSSSGCQLRETTLRVRCCDLKDILDKILMIRSLVSLVIAYCETVRAFSSYVQGMCHNLSELRIIFCENMENVENVMDVLGKFPKLQKLIVEGEFQKVVRFGMNSFPELKILELRYVKNLCKLEVEKGGLPKLKKLDIEDCRNLEKLPDEVRSISTLERLVCFDMSRKFTDRYRRGEDYATWSHILHFL